MKITQQDYKEKLDNSSGFKTIKYKHISFEMYKSESGSRFKLKPNSVIFILTIIILATFNLVLGYILTSNNSNGTFYALGLLLLLYFCRKLALYFTEKRYHQELVEFQNILQSWKESQHK